MEATRNRGRGKIFSCFRPVVLVHDDDGDEPISDSASLQSSGDEGGARRKRNLRRSFSAALKAVVFRTELLKKSRSENHHVQEYYDGLRSHILSRGRSFVRSLKKNMSRKPFLEPDDFFWSKNKNRSPIFSSNSSSRTPSLASSSSSGSSRSSPTRSEPDTNIQRSISLDHFRQIVPTNKQKTMKKDSGKKCGYTIPTLEVCVLLVCLFALIWGKVFAIVACTSAWLFLSPDRRSQKLSYEVFDSEEYKKRVIMGGLLERSDRCRFPLY